MLANRHSRYGSARVVGANCSALSFRQIGVVESAKSFLVVDDHEIVRTGLREIIETRSGWKVTGEAANGKQGIELARAKKPDVVIVDYSMPILNGLEVCRHIKSHGLATQVLFLTVQHKDGGNPSCGGHAQAGIVFDC